MILTLFNACDSIIYSGVMLDVIVTWIENCREDVGTI